MQEVITFLQKNSNGFLATVENGDPRVRPFQFMLEDSGKFYFCTSNTKYVFRQLKAHPVVEFSSSSPAFEWIRLSGQIKFTDDITIKEKIITTNELVKSIYKKGDNPIFEVFYIEHGKAVLYSFSGQPPKTFIL